MSDTFDHAGDAFYQHYEIYGTFPPKSSDIDFNWKPTELEKEHDERIARDELLIDNLNERLKPILKKLNISYHGGGVYGYKFVDAKEIEYNSDNKLFIEAKRIGKELTRIYLNKGRGAEPTDRAYVYWKLSTEAKEIAKKLNFDPHTEEGVTEETKKTEEYKRFREIVNMLHPDNGQ